MNLRTRVVAVTCGALLTLVRPASSQHGAVPAALDDMVRRIFGTAEFRSKDRMVPGTWIEGGAAWLQLDTAPGGREVIRIATASGSRSTLASVADLTPKGASQPINPEQVVLSTDGRYLLIYAASAKVRRADTRGDYWVLDQRTMVLRQLGAGAPPSSLMYATFAPTNDRVAYARGGDLYVERIADGAVTRLTTGGDSLHLSGTTDWAYEEEFGLRQAFAWSPDGARIAYLHFDITGVPRQTLIDDLSARYPVTFSFPYPKVGETLPSVRLGVVTARGGATVWASMSGDARAHYLPRFGWSDDQALIVQRAAVAAAIQQPLEFLRVDIGNGTELDGWMIKPAHFDSTKRYPVLVHTYGGPGAQSVLDRFQGNNALWHHALAEAGMVVMGFDNRGTPSPRGRDFRKAMAGLNGVLSSADQAEAVRRLTRAHRWVDSTRVAIWGWSGGGTNTLQALFRYPGVYAVGMAVAPIADFTLYDAPFQERYMGLPASNDGAFDRASAIKVAEGLQGNLLIVHGSGDDNVQYQGTAQLVDRLVALGKPFDLMVYPNRSHCICEGPGTTLHLYRLLTRYLFEHIDMRALP